MNDIRKINKIKTQSRYLNLFKINSKIFNYKISNFFNKLLSTIIYVIMIVVILLSFNNYLESRNTFMVSWNISNFKEFINESQYMKNNIKLKIMRNDNVKINYDTIEMKISQQFNISNEFFININNKIFIDKINDVLIKYNFIKFNKKESKIILEKFNDFKINRFKTIPFIY